MSEEQETKTAAVIIRGFSYDQETLEKIKEVMSNISKTISKIEGGYLSICGDVAYLYDTQAWHASGHKNIYDLCADKYGMSRGTVQNLRTIYEHYGDGNYKLSGSIGDKKITDLLKEIKDLKKLAAEVHREEIKNGTGPASQEAPGDEPEKPQREKRKQLLKVEITTESADWSREELAAELVKRMGDLSIGSDFTFQLIITG